MDQPGGRRWRRWLPCLNLPILTPGEGGRRAWPALRDRRRNARHRDCQTNPIRPGLGGPGKSEARSSKQARRANDPNAQKTRNKANWALRARQTNPISALLGQERGWGAKTEPVRRAGGRRQCRTTPSRTGGKMAIPFRATGYSSGVPGEPRMSKTYRGCQSSGRPSFVGREWAGNRHPGRPRIGASRGGIWQRYRAPGRRVPPNPTQPSELSRRWSSRGGTCGGAIRSPWRCW